MLHELVEWVWECWFVRVLDYFRDFMEKNCFFVGFRKYFGI